MRDFNGNFSVIRRAHIDGHHQKLSWALFFASSLKQKPSRFEIIDLSQEEF